MLFGSPEPTPLWRRRCRPPRSSGGPTGRSQVTAARVDGSLELWLISLGTAGASARRRYSVAGPHSPKREREREAEEGEREEKEEGKEPHAACADGSVELWFLSLGAVGASALPPAAATLPPPPKREREREGGGRRDKPIMVPAKLSFFE